MTKTFIPCPHCTKTIGFLDWQIEMPLVYFDCPFCFKNLDVKPSVEERVVVGMCEMVYCPVRDTLRLERLI